MYVYYMVGFIFYYCGNLCIIVVLLWQFMYYSLLYVGVLDGLVYCMYYGDNIGNYGIMVVCLQYIYCGRNIIIVGLLLVFNILYLVLFVLWIIYCIMVVFYYGCLYG